MEENTSAAPNGAVWDIIIISAFSVFLMALLKVLLKYVERQDSKVQGCISNMRKMIREKPRSFREVNSYNWDYVMVFKVQYDDDQHFSAYQRKYSVKKILSRLATGGIETRMYYSLQRDAIYCKIRCPLDRLSREADRIDYKLLLDSTALRRSCQSGRPGLWGSITISDEHNVSRFDPYDFIYAPYVYNSPETEGLYTKYDTGGGKIHFRGVDRLKLEYNIMTAKQSDGGCNLDIVRLLKEKCLLAFIPLHDIVEKRNLQHMWLMYNQAPWNQPVEDVKNYFGEKVGLYFLWLGHYTTWLLPASIVGVAAWLDVALRGGNPNTPSIAAFAVFIGLWSTMFTEFWKRKQSMYAMKWGMTGFEEEEQTRPQFKGEMCTSPVNGQPVDYFPRKKANMRLLVSGIVICFLILIVIAAVFSIFLLKHYMHQNRDDWTVLGIDFSNIIPSVVNAIQIIIMNSIYSELAVRLNDLENHRTDTAYEDNLIAKTFMFQFVNSYASLIYIAFIKKYVPGETLCPNSCMDELSTNLGTIFLLRLTLGNIMEVGIPLAKLRRKEKAEMSGSDPQRGMSVAESEFMLETYDVMLGPFRDYVEMVIQFGYATLFVAAYPLSCLMAFINNYIELRVDAWRLLMICKRPEPRGSEDIGTWYTILEIMSIIAVITNSALIAFTSDLFDNRSNAARVGIFLVFEHGMWAFKFALALLIPDVPTDVDIQLQRQKFIVSKVVHNAPDQDDDELVKDQGKLSDHAVFQTDGDP